MASALGLLVVVGLTTGFGNLPFEEGDPGTTFDVADLTRFGVDGLRSHEREQCLPAYSFPTYSRQ
jgi:hypothetical protein